MDMQVLSSGDSLIIVGSGGYSIELIGLLEGSNINVLGYLGPHRNSKLLSYEYLGAEDNCIKYRNQPMIVAIGNPNIRAKVTEMIQREGCMVKTYIHPLAYVSSKAEVGSGCVIYPNSTIHSHVSIGNGVLVNSNVSIGHETVIGDFSTICPGVSLGGKIQVGERVYFGIGSICKEGLNITDDVLIGANSLVLKNLETTGTYIGSPSFIINE